MTGCRPHVDARHRLREAMSPEPMASDRRGGGLTSHRWTRFKFGSLLLGLGRCHVLGPASSLVTGLCPSHLWGPSDALGGRKDRGARAGQTQQFSPVSRPGRGRGRSAGVVGGPPAGVARRSRGGRASGREQVPGMRSPGPAQPAETASVFGLRSRLGAFQSLRFRCAAKSGRPVPGPHLILSLPCAGATSHLVTSSSRRPGPKCHRRGCCPLARAESPPRPDIPLCLPPWLGRPPWPTHPPPRSARSASSQLGPRG